MVHDDPTARTVEVDAGALWFESEQGGFGYQTLGWSGSERLSNTLRAGTAGPAVQAQPPAYATNWPVVKRLVPSR